LKFKTETMKKVLFFLIIIGVAFASCKSSKKAAKTAFEPAAQPVSTVAEPKVFQVPEVKPTPATEDEKPIAVRKESFTFTEAADQNQNSYFIILGSFSSMDNAKNFRQTLMSEGFTPIIVQSETGYYRVTVDSFTSEAPARTRLMQIRQSFPKYNDAWLLIKN
jgi:cell division protein FtsN